MANGFNDFWQLIRKSKYACFGSELLLYYAYNPAATVNNAKVIWIISPLRLMRRLNWAADGIGEAPSECFQETSGHLEVFLPNALCES